MNSIVNETMNRLQAIFPADCFSQAPDVRNCYSRDRSIQPAEMPLAVVWPETAEQVAELLKLCNETRLPVTARGAGTSLEGNSIPSKGGIILSMERMNKVLEILPQDFEARVQPGVVYDDLNRQLAEFGLFFAPAPSSGSVATIGGMVGNNAGGINALRYGVTRNHVLRLQVALADGTLVWYGTRAFKTSSGFDLVQLMIGSEGLLGIVTEITLRLYALPERRTTLVQFQELDEAAQAVFEIITTRILPGALELIDPVSIQHVNRYKGWDWAELPTLLIEFHGSAAGIEKDIETVKAICARLGARKFELAASPAMAEQLWSGRKEITNAEETLFPNYTILNGDIAVPLSQYSRTVRQARDLGLKYGLPVSIFGHAGDGNIHCHMLVPPGDAGALENGRLAAAALIRFALSVGGTATAEHGIGLAKKEFLVEEHGVSVEVMKKIKRALDPNNILNPGKMFLGD